MEANLGMSPELRPEQKQQQIFAKETHILDGLRSPDGNREAVQEFKERRIRAIQEANPGDVFVVAVMSADIEEKDAAGEKNAKVNSVGKGRLIEDTYRDDGANTDIHTALQAKGTKLRQIVVSPVLATREQRYLSGIDQNTPQGTMDSTFYADASDLCSQQIYEAIEAARAAGEVACVYMECGYLGSLPVVTEEDRKRGRPFQGKDNRMQTEGQIDPFVSTFAALTWDPEIGRNTFLYLLGGKMSPELEKETLQRSVHEAGVQKRTEMFQALRAVKERIKKEGTISPNDPLYEDLYQAFFNNGTVYRVPSENGISEDVTDVEWRELIIWDSQALIDVADFIAGTMNSPEGIVRVKKIMAEHLKELEAQTGKKMTEDKFIEIIRDRFNFQGEEGAQRVLRSINVPLTSQQPRYDFSWSTSSLTALSYPEYFDPLNNALSKISGIKAMLNVLNPASPDTDYDSTDNVEEYPPGVYPSGYSPEIHPDLFRKNSDGSFTWIGLPPENQERELGS